MSKEKLTEPSAIPAKRKGRVEYLANKAEIDALQSRGYGMHDIYLYLVDVGKVTVSYATLSAYITRGIDTPFGKKNIKRKNVNINKKEQFKNKSINTPVEGRVNDGVFVHPKNININKIINGEEK